MSPCGRGVWRSVSRSVFQPLSVGDRLIDTAPDPEHFGRRSRRVTGTDYNDAAGRTPADAVTSDLGGQTLAPGVYKADSAMSLTGTGTRTSFPVASATSGGVSVLRGKLTDLLAWLQRPAVSTPNTTPALAWTRSTSDHDGQRAK
jgi:hypothetical protein